MSQQEVIAMLEALIGLGRRVEAGLRHRAAVAGQFAPVLRRRADEHAAMTEELQRERDWLAVVAAVSGQPVPTAQAGVPPPPPPAAGLEAASDEELLADCERAGCRAVDAWREALEGPLPKRLRPLLQRQHQALQRSHRRMQVLLHLARHGNVLLPLQCPAAAASRWPVLAPGEEAAELVCQR